MSVCHPSPLSHSTPRTCQSALLADLFHICLPPLVSFLHNISHLSVSLICRSVPYLFSITRLCLAIHLTPVGQVCFLDLFYICFPPLVSVPQHIWHLSVNFVCRSVLYLFATTRLCSTAHLAPVSQLCRAVLYLFATTRPCPAVHLAPVGQLDL